MPSRPLPDASAAVLAHFRDAWNHQHASRSDDGRLERQQVLPQDFLHAALVAGHGHVRVGGGEAVPGKMLAHGSHPGFLQSQDQLGSKSAHRGGVEVQRPVADHAAAAVVEVEHRGEAEIHAMRAELRADHVAGRLRRLPALLAVAVPQAPELAHRRDRGKAFAEALHAPALVVDTNG